MGEGEEREERQQRGEVAESVKKSRDKEYGGRLEKVKSRSKEEKEGAKKE